MSFNIFCYGGISYRFLKSCICFLVVVFNLRSSTLHEPIVS